MTTPRIMRPVIVKTLMDLIEVISEHDVEISARNARKYEFRLAISTSAEHIDSDYDDKAHDNPY
jgi:hypothetical protein